MTTSQDPRAVQTKLNAFNMMALLLRHAANLLHDAKGFAEQVNADGWYSSRIGEFQDGLKTEILPEVDAAIKALEAEIRP